MIKLKTMTSSEKFDLPKTFTWIAMDNQNLPNFISIDRKPRKPEEITNGLELFCPKEDSLIMLQYSSGSTGTPKGTLLRTLSLYYKALC
jgi:long-subunit acyl-CoA synthetase (AMP-forming)